MNRIDQQFQTLKAMNKTAFIAFLTAGDPTLETCKECLLQLAKNDCDLIEIGIPFSDPAADGPIIQEANLRALSHHIKTDDVLQMIKDVRPRIEVPLVCLLYYNQIFTYGIKAFLQKCVDSGVDGLIIPDLPLEHQEEILPYAQDHGIHIISLVTPISASRKQVIAQRSKGFLYCVTSLGVTGERSTFEQDLKSFIAKLREYSDTPKALGFGISTIEQIKQLKQFADGLIVGSAIVKEIAKLSDGETTLDDIGFFVKQMADACHN